MREVPIKEQKYGQEVFSNKFMDTLRKTECLCLNCSNMESCDIAHNFYKQCIDNNIALAVTRCPKWNSKNN